MMIEQIPVPALLIAGLAMLGAGYGLGFIDGWLRGLNSRAENATATSPKPTTERR